jgi:hypothetical protein
MATARKRILSAALLLPVVLFSVVWTSFALWRCQFDGVARTKCCCPKPPAAHAAAVLAQDQPTGTAVERAATISRPACCDREQIQVDRAPAEVTRNNVLQAAVAMATSLAATPLAVLPRLEVPAAVAREVPLDGDGPPTGRTLLRQKQTLLL